MCLVVTRCQYWWGPCKVRSNKQVWIALQWRPPDVTSRGSWMEVPMSHVYGDGELDGPLVPSLEGKRAGFRVGPGPCTVRSNAPWVMITWGPPGYRLIDRHIWLKNITFLQLHWWAIIMDWWPPSGVGTILILPEFARVPPWRKIRLIRHFQESFLKVFQWVYVRKFL